MDLSPELHPGFTILYLLIFVIGLAVELYAVFSPRTGDTITEHWRWIRDNIPKPVRWLYIAATAAAIIWLFAHFIFGF